MRRWSALVCVALFLLVAAPILSGTPSSSVTATDAADTGPATAAQTNASGAGPGTAMSSAVAVQGATIDGAIRAETVAVRLETAGTPAARARVAADVLDRSETRARALESRLQALDVARENDSLSRESYDARVVPIAANARSLAAIVDRTRNGTADIDTETLREAGATDDRIGALRARLDRLIAVDPRPETTGALGSGFYRRVATVAAAHNENVVSENLGVLGTYLNDERINLHVVRDDGETEVVSFRTTGEVRVRELRAGPHPDANLRVTVDEQTARRLLDSDRPGPAANRAFLAGEITVDGLTRFTALKWTLVNTVLGVVRFVLGLLGFLIGLLP